MSLSVDRGAPVLQQELKLWLQDIFGRVKGMINVLGYVRVSTLNQVKEGYSLGEQEDEIRKYCDINGYNLVQIFSDEGKSGAKTDIDEEKIERDGLLDLFDRLQTGDIQYVVVLGTNRLWRSDMVKMIIHREFKKYSVDIKAIDLPSYSIYSDNPTDILINGVIEVIDRYERSEIARKLKRGRMKKAECGGYSGGGAPFGYRAVRGAKVLEVVPEEAQVVRRVFELAEGYPDMALRKIALQVTTEGYRARNGKAIGGMMVKRILEREAFYRGIYKYGDVESIGQHDSIL